MTIAIRLEIFAMSMVALQPLFTAAQPVGFFFNSSGNATNTCQKTPCLPCPVGFYSTNCMRANPGTCVACSILPANAIFTTPGGVVLPNVTTVQQADSCLWACTDGYYRNESATGPVCLPNPAADAASNVGVIAGAVVAGVVVTGAVAGGVVAASSGAAAAGAGASAAAAAGAAGAAREYTDGSTGHGGGGVRGDFVSTSMPRLLGHKIVRVTTQPIGGDVKDPREVRPLLMLGA